MTTFEQFSQSLETSTAPAHLSEPLQALWHGKKGDWEKAHQIVQNLSTPEAAWVHAWLHRQEGDNSNAAYWYAQAGKKASSKGLEAEWEHMVRNLLSW
jgi:hypothetical protein